MAEQDSEQPKTPETPPVQDAADDFDKDRAMATIHKLREFEKAAKSQLKDMDDLRAKLKALEDAKLSDQEKLAARLKEVEGKAQELEAKRLEAEAQLVRERKATRVAQIAGQLNAYDPLDPNFLAAVADIDPNAEGAQKAIQSAIEALKKTKPYLFRQGSPNLAAFNPGAGGGPVPESDAARRQRLYTGGGANPFDPEVARAKGGGVIFPRPPDG